MGRKKSQQNNSPSYLRQPGAKNDSFTPLFGSMVDSPACRSLTDKQFRLLTDMLSAVGRQQHSKKQDDKPPAEYGGDSFFFPRALWFSTLKRYTNESRFYADLDSLIAHGFVDVLSSGKNTREKSVYRLSTRWHKFGTPDFVIPENVKSTRMKKRREPP